MSPRLRQTIGSSTLRRIETRYPTRLELETMGMDVGHRRAVWVRPFDTDAGVHFTTLIDGPERDSDDIGNHLQKGTMVVVAHRWTTKFHRVPFDWTLENVRPP